jgi:hypothetical protein
LQTADNQEVHLAEERNHRLLAVSRYKIMLHAVKQPLAARVPVVPRVQV